MKYIFFWQIFLFQFCKSHASISYQMSINERQYVEINNEIQDCEISSDKQNILKCKILNNSEDYFQIDKQLGIQDVSNIVIYDSENYRNCFAFVYQHNKIAFTQDLKQISSTLITNSIDLSIIVKAPTLTCHNIYSGGSRRDFLLFCLQSNENKFYAVVIDNTFNCDSHQISLGTTLGIYQLNVSTLKEPTNYEIKHLRNKSLSQFLFLVMVSDTGLDRYFTDVMLYNLSEVRNVYNPTILEVPFNLGHLTDVSFLQSKNQVLEFTICFQNLGMCKFSISLPLIAGSTLQLKCDSNFEFLRTVEYDSYYSIFTYSPLQAYGIQTSDSYLEISMITKFYIISYNYKDSIFYPIFKKKLNDAPEQNQVFYKFFNVDDQYFYYQLQKSNDSTQLIVFEKSLQSKKQVITVASQQSQLVSYIPFTYYSQQMHMSCKMDKKFLYFTNLADILQITDIFVEFGSFMILESFANEVINISIQLTAKDGTKELRQVNIKNSNNKDLDYDANAVTQYPDIQESIFIIQPKIFFKGQGINLSESHNQKYAPNSVQLVNQQQEEIDQYCFPFLLGKQFSHRIFSLVANSKIFIAHQFALFYTSLLCGNSNYTIQHASQLLEEINFIEGKFILVYYRQDLKEYAVYRSICQDLPTTEPILFNYNLVSQRLPNLNFETFSIKLYTQISYLNYFILINDVSATSIPQNFSNYFLYVDFQFGQLNCLQINVDEQIISIDVALLNYKIIFVSSLYKIYYLYLPPILQNLETCMTINNPLEFNIIEGQNKEIATQLINFPRFNSSVPPGLMVITFGEEESVDLYFLRNMEDLTDIEHLILPIKLIKEKGAHASLTELREVKNFQLQLEGNSLEFAKVGAINFFVLIDQYFYIYSHNIQNKELIIFSFNILAESGNQLSFISYSDSLSQLWILPSQHTVLDEFSKIKVPQKILLSFGNGCLNKGQICWKKNYKTSFFVTHLIINQAQSRQSYFKVSILAKNYDQLNSTSIEQIFQFTDSDRNLRVFVDSKNLISNRFKRPIVNDSIFSGSLCGVNINLEGKTLNISKHVEQAKILINPTVMGPYQISDKYLFSIENGSKSIFIYQVDNEEPIQKFQTEMEMDLILVSEIDEQNRIIIITQTKSSQNLYQYEFLTKQNKINKINNFYLQRPIFDDQKVWPSNKAQISIINSNNTMLAYCQTEPSSSQWRDSSLIIVNISKNYSESYYINALQLDEVNYFNCNLIRVVGSTIYFSDGQNRFYKADFSKNNDLSNKSQYLSQLNIQVIQTKGTLWQFINHTHFIDQFEKYFTFRGFVETKIQYSNQDLIQFYYSSDCQHDVNFRQHLIIKEQLIVPCFTSSNNNILNLQYYKNGYQPQKYMREIYQKKIENLSSYQIWTTPLLAKESRFYLLIKSKNQTVQIWEMKLENEITVDLNNLQIGKAFQANYCGSVFENGKIEIQKSSCVYVTIDNFDYDKINSRLEFYAWLLFGVVLACHAVIFICFMLSGIFNRRIKRKSLRIDF